MKARKVKQLILCASVLTWCCAALQLLAIGNNDRRGNYDETRYALLAETLFTDELAQLPQPPQYPPGWPVVMKLVMWAGGGFAEIHLLNRWLIVVTSVLVILYLRQQVGTSLCIATAFSGIFLASRHTWYYADSLLAEPLFMLLFLMLLLVVDFPALSYSPSLPRLLAAGLLITALRCVRTVGIAFAAAAIVHVVFLDRSASLRSRLTRLAILILSFVLVEVGMTILVPSGDLIGGYTAQSQAEMNIYVKASGILLHFRELASACVPMNSELWHPRIFFMAFGVILAAVSLVSIIVECVYDRRLSASLICGYLLLISLWVSQSPRFFWPVVPCMLAAAVRSLQRLAVRWHWAFGPNRNGPITFGVQFAVVVYAVLAVVAVAIKQPDVHGRRSIADKRERAFVAALRHVDTSINQPFTVGTYHCYRTYWHRPRWSIVRISHPNNHEQAANKGANIVLCENQRLVATSWVSNGWTIVYDNGSMTVLKKMPLATSRVKS